MPRYSIGGVIVHSAVFDRHFYGRLVLSLALVPLVRIISLCVPLVNIPQMWWYPIIYVPLLVAAIRVVHILGHKGREVGLNFRSFPVQLASSVYLVTFVNPRYNGTAVGRFSNLED